MAKIGFFSHAVSDTVNALVQQTAFTEAGHTVYRMRRDGTSSFRGRVNSVIVNYGSSREQIMENVAAGRILNSPLSVLAASNKRRAFQSFENNNIPTPEFTHDRDVAQGWIDGGSSVYIRTTLQGHSGEGIVYASPEQTVGNLGNIVRHPHGDRIPQAPLYTKAIEGDRREYRVHVFDGRILHVAQKRRVNGYQTLENYSNIVRNHHTGWVYSTENMTAISGVALKDAARAVAALGLDFGAVDIVTRRNQHWILEVNTAPGMEGVTLDRYTQAILKYVNNEEPVGVITDNLVDTARYSVSELITTAHAEGQNADYSRFVVGSTTITVEQPANPEPIPAPAPIVEEAPVPQQTATRAATSQPTETRATTALINDEYYFISLADNQTVGQYHRVQNSFSIIGHDVPVDYNAEVTVIGRASIQR